MHTPWVVSPCSIATCTDATRFNGARAATSGLIVFLDTRWHRYVKCCCWIWILQIDFQFIRHLKKDKRRLQTSQ